MKRLTTAPNLALATLWADLLSHAGVPTTVQRQYASSIAGEVPPDQTLPELWVQDRDQLEQARIAAQTVVVALSSAFVPLIRMAILAGFIATLVIGGFLTLEGKLAVGAYSVLIFLTQRLLWPLTALAQTVDLYQRAMASARRVLDLLGTDRRDDRALGLVSKLAGLERDRLVSARDRA